jgi:hypothetical protein
MATEPTLRPTRWPGPPRRATVLRAGLVATFLALAAGALYAIPPADDSGSDAAAETVHADAEGAQRPTGSDVPDRMPVPDGVSAPDRMPAPDGVSAPDRVPAPDETPVPVLDGMPVPDGAVGVPVPLAEPAVLAVVRPGTRVNLLAVPPARRPGATVEPVLLAERAPVLAVLRPAATDGSAAVYLALHPEQARRLIGMPPDARFAIAVLP